MRNCVSYQVLTVTFHTRSNRSAAVLQLNKVSKALADAEECINLRSDWDKGYFRRAAALEKMDRWEEVRAFKPLYLMLCDINAPAITQPYNSGLQRVWVSNRIFYLYELEVNIPPF